MARFWFALALLLAACDSPKIGEVGPEACSNMEDDDHDDRIDCDDPDCQNLDMCRIVIALDGGETHHGHVPEGGVLSPPLRLDSGIVSKPHMDSGMPSNNPPDEDDSGVSIPIVDAGPVTCDPKCTDTEQCIEGTCKAVTANTSQTIAVRITDAKTPDTTVIIPMCLEAECSLLVGCCPIDPYVRVVQIHDSKETVIGSTKVVTTSGGVIVGRVRDVPYKDATTWTVDLAEGDLLQFELWDHNDENPDQRIFACKADLTMLDPSEQTCSGFVNGVIGELIGTISAVLTPKE